MAQARDETKPHEALRRENMALRIDLEVEAMRSSALRRLFLDGGEPARKASEEGNSAEHTSDNNEHTSDNDRDGAEAPAADTVRSVPTPPALRNLVAMRDAIPRFRMDPAGVPKDISHSICINTLVQPFAPASFGRGGLYFSLENVQVHDGGRYVYRGCYKSMKWRTMSIAEWQALPTEVWATARRRTAADCLPLYQCKTWWLEHCQLNHSEQIAKIRPRLLARQQLGRPTTFELRHVFPDETRRAYILEAFNSGEVVLHVTVLKCIGIGKDI
ncbi:hypothetical protein FA95DRAFT_1578639 [Auriscalpium vulgare]|uniref:Uncharacterized protein n=1 Tax=Auriscalpium vulgare TaxID=40419 RepID=A0ACB8R288_9AGAM|nr:hypothetical protein FA95DRAFT_1578639 [Auriscalpium vulgare]